MKKFTAKVRVCAVFEDCAQMAVYYVLLWIESHRKAMVDLMTCLATNWAKVVPRLPRDQKLSDCPLWLLRVSNTKIFFAVDLIFIPPLTLVAGPHLLINSQGIEFVSSITAPRLTLYCSETAMRGMRTEVDSLVKCFWSSQASTAGQHLVDVKEAVPEEIVGFVFCVTVGSL